MLGGDIHLVSEFGKGSIFSFRLPYKPATNRVNLEKHDHKTPELKKDLTVLVVEDEDINWLYINEILKNKVNTINAVNGSQAMEILKKHPEIKVVLMDIKLPNINGLELTRMIRSYNSNIKVIAQTAFALSGDREKAFEAGCSGYLTKPVNKDKLLNLISLNS